MRKEEYEPFFMSMVLMSVFVLLVNIYYYEYPVFLRLGLQSGISDKIMLSLRSDGIFSSYLITKTVSLFFIIMSSLVRSGKGKAAD